MRKAKVIKTSTPKPADSVVPASEVAVPEVVIDSPAVEIAAPVPAVIEPVKAPRGKKPKLVRDSFTFPESDYVLIAGLKLRALSQEAEFKKSEILRAGLLALQSLSDAELLSVLGKIERIKTGRPAKK